MKLALIQYAPEWENPHDSIIKLNLMLENQISDEDLLIFPEMTLTGFTMQSKKYAEEIDGPGMRFFINIAQRYKKNVIAGIIEYDEGRIYNSSFHFDSNGIIMARYRKIHPFSLAKENENYSAGREPLVSHIDKTKIGLAVCYDLRFPELYRYYGKANADIMVTIANWPVPRIEHWKTLLKARAIENLCYSVGVNRVGSDPKNKYNGCSVIYDPTGQELVLVENEEKIISVEIEIEKVNETREKFPFLNDLKLI